MAKWKKGNLIQRYKRINGSLRISADDIQYREKTNIIKKINSTTHTAVRQSC